MLNIERTQQAAPADHRLIASFARNEEEVLEAQRLRHKIFAEEMGAFLPYDDVDRDIFDRFCNHLLVRENDDNKVVGTCRIMSPYQAQKAGGYYSQTEFDLSRLLHLRESLVEVGRACIHPEFRNDTTFAHMWSGIRQHMQQNRHEYLIACIGISLADGGHNAASLYRKLFQDHGVPIEYRAFPRNPLPLKSLNQNLDPVVPHLLKGYLQLGAYICGEPAWDATCNTADLLVMLPLARLSSEQAGER